MLTTERLIKNAESKWLNILESYCHEIFKEVHLPSHDETHHKRVWERAKELLLQLSKNGAILNEKTIEQLIIAVFFHDTGMSVTMQKEHGTISRGIAKEFLKDKNIHSQSLDEILAAIENHDQKDYNTSIISGQPEFTVQSLLNISDDLDALGIIGAYRYSEIYLLRNVSVQEMPDVILDNLHKRYQHMKAYLSFSHNYLKAQNIRYMATRNFFKDLSFQIKQVGDELSTLNGPIGIVNFIKEFLINQRLHVKEASKNASLIASDFYVTNFFEKLEKESSI